MVTKIEVSPSEQAVLDWLAENGLAFAGQVGEALHAKVNAMPEWALSPPMDEIDRRRIRRKWAYKLLTKLYVMGKVVSTGPSASGQTHGELWRVMP